MAGRDIHAEHGRLVPVLRSLLPREADDAGECAACESPEHPVRAVRRDTLRRDRQRPLALLGIARREGVRMLAEAAQTQRPVGDGVVGNEPPKREVR